MNIGILASHNGTNLQAIIDAQENGVIVSKVSVVISNNSKSGAIQRAMKHGIPYAHLSGKTHENSTELDKAILSKLKQNECDLIFLAGYMKKLGPETLAEFKGRILNTHAALLPKFGGKGMYGMHVHKAVIENRESESGVSIHLVDENYDTGKVIAQTVVPVITDDTPESLCARVMERERAFVVETIKRIEEKKIAIKD